MGQCMPWLRPVFPCNTMVEPWQWIRAADTAELYKQVEKQNLDSQTWRQSTRLVQGVIKITYLRRIKDWHSKNAIISDKLIRKKQRNRTLHFRGKCWLLIWLYTFIIACRAVKLFFHSPSKTKLVLNEIFSIFPVSNNSILILFQASVRVRVLSVNRSSGPDTRYESQCWSRLELVELVSLLSAPEHDPRTHTLWQQSVNTGPWSPAEVSPGSPTQFLITSTSCQSSSLQTSTTCFPHWSRLRASRYRECVIKSFVQTILLISVCKTSDQPLYVVSVMTSSGCSGLCLQCAVVTRAQWSLLRCLLVKVLRMLSRTKSSSAAPPHLRSWVMVDTDTRAGVMHMSSPLSSKS